MHEQTEFWLSLWYSFLKNLMDRGAWKSTVHGVAKELDTLRDCIFAPAKRSYPTSKVRGSGREYQTATAQEWLRGATLRPRSGGRPRGDTQHPRSGAVAGRHYPTPPRPRPGAEAGRSNPGPRPGAATRGVTRSRGCAAQEGLEELSHIEGQEGWWWWGDTPRPR